VWVRKLEQAGEDPPVVRGVVHPTSTDEVAAVVADAAARGQPLLPVGLGSNVVGALVPRGDEVALDLSGLDRLRGVDPVSLVARVDAGLRGAVLERALARRGLTLGHAPQSLALSTVGGWIATRSSGATSTRDGSIERRVLALEVVLADGTVVRTPEVPRSGAGPDPAAPFIGSEGALGVITGASLAVRRRPAERRFRAFALPSFATGLEAVRLIVQDDVAPAVVRLYEQREARRFAPRTPGALLVVVHEGGPLLDTEERAVADRCLALGGEALGEGPARAWWRRRFDAPFLAVADRPGSIADAVETAATWSRAARLAERLLATLEPLASHLHLHASHFYASGTSLYLTFFVDAAGPREALAAYEEAWRRALRVCVEDGAALSHHHGVGRLRLPWVESGLGAGAEILRRLKAALDPADLLSPGRLVPPAEGRP
jgi:alkyldihydroxyacetonephosphate synthase